MLLHTISATVALLTHFYLILTQLSEKVEEVPQFVQGPEPRAVQPRISQDKLDSAAITANLQSQGLKITNGVLYEFRILFSIVLTRGPHLKVVSSPGFHD